MKLQKELKPLINDFNKIKDQIPAHVKKVKQDNNYKDLEVRIAYDCLRTVRSPQDICQWYDKYNCNDEHITTLAKRALKEVYKIES